jgi:hypothetical protein
VTPFGALEKHRRLVLASVGLKELTPQFWEGEDSVSFLQLGAKKLAFKGPHV